MKTLRIVSCMHTNRWGHIHVCIHVQTQTHPLFHFTHHRLSLFRLLCFAHSPLSSFPSSIFSLTEGVEDPHHNQSWWSHGAQRHTQGTAVQIREDVKKKGEKKEREEKRRDEVEEETWGCVWIEGGARVQWGAQSKNGPALCQGRSGMVGWTGAIGEAPVRHRPSPESCAWIQMWACHWYSPPVLLPLPRFLFPN